MHGKSYSSQAVTGRAPMILQQRLDPEKEIKHSAYTMSASITQSSLITNAVIADHRRGYRWPQTRSSLTTDAVIADHRRGYRWSQTQSLLTTDAVIADHRRGYLWPPTRSSLTTVCREDTRLRQSQWRWSYIATINFAETDIRRRWIYN